MKSISVPPLVTPQVKGNLSDLPVRNAVRAPDAVAFNTLSSGTWVDVTNADFLADVRAVAKGLMASGVGLGQRVAIMSRTRYEWTLVDFAIWTAGAISVPIYETSSAEQVSWIVVVPAPAAWHSGAGVERRHHTERVVDPLRT